MQSKATSSEMQVPFGIQRPPVPYEHYDRKAHQLRSDHVVDSLGAVAKLVRGMFGQIKSLKAVT